MTAAASRSEFLAPLIGEPWSWRARNCWEFAAHVQRELFGRTLPSVAVPDEPKWRWMIAEIGRNPERARWREVEQGPHGLITAADGALVLMGRFAGAGHIGVWLAAERKVIHCDRRNGVCCEDVQALRSQGWISISFWEPNG
ncbi:hypothetical protein ACQR2B_06570 [Bradyrhizobium oligotrophicum]|uniref:hypothetical protein n=1 Tax=Bradyrhizobium TaxID=374 RepID=UPI003EB87D74